MQMRAYGARQVNLSAVALQNGGINGADLSTIYASEAEMKKFALLVFGILLAFVLAGAPAAGEHGENGGINAALSVNNHCRRT